MSELLIVNASPLIFLGKAGRLDLLRSMTDQPVLVPDAVYREVVSDQQLDAAARAIAASSWLIRSAPVSVPTAVLEWDLGAGESSVIALALAHPGSSAVLDDLSGRKCALSLGIQVVGTIGLVVAAHRRGDIDDPRAMINELRAAGMWLSDAVVEKALALAGR